ncbi:MAG TPA: TetR/AcrR family transcriptional regulator [Anaerovoracaceae bacterium]|nr:TetR/AcrR family transcriptional regulator [Anaerovoracaceae bacterium]
MSIKERKEREKDDRRKLILNAANEIIMSEGIDHLSIRKIAGMIDYSPTIIYHYFKDKDDIISHLMNKGYMKIANTLSSTPIHSDEPDIRLKELTRNYIDTALEMSAEYKAIHLSSSPAVLEYTSSLFEGASTKNAALGILFQCLKDILKSKDIPDISIELTAQVFMSAAFGLIIKLIVEKDIDEGQRERLIEHFIKCSVDGMILGKSFTMIERNL